MPAVPRGCGGFFVFRPGTLAEQVRSHRTALVLRAERSDCSLRSDGPASSPIPSGRGLASAAVGTRYGVSHVEGAAAELMKWDTKVAEVDESGPIIR
ncbi:hypothetical protein MES4922_190255 [Mesorhizobium ventifaucium]|uniref:Uncharacterized protein n=1 Tax=Mesorhizobium ventifaucium TaxID=666020 RepID=A0ABM9DLM1_9HYPH|nr:hypothetical protein MES4922_190255 [Mesorhizobium ventifaucium]